MMKVSFLLCVLIEFSDYPSMLEITVLDDDSAHPKHDRFEELIGICHCFCEVCEVCELLLFMLLEKTLTSSPRLSLHLLPSLTSFTDLFFLEYGDQIVKCEGMEILTTLVKSRDAPTRSKACSILASIAISPGAKGRR